MPDGAEIVQLQGVHVATLLPGLQDEGNGLLQRIAGDMSPIPVVGWYLLLALVTVSPTAQRAAPFAQSGCTAGGLRG